MNSMKKVELLTEKAESLAVLAKQSASKLLNTTDSDMVKDTTTELMALLSAHRVRLALDDGFGERTRSDLETLGLTVSDSDDLALTLHSLNQSLDAGLDANIVRQQLVDDHTAFNEIKAYVSGAPKPVEHSIEVVEAESTALMRLQDRMSEILPELTPAELSLLFRQSEDQDEFEILSFSSQGQISPLTELTISSALAALLEDGNARIVGTTTEGSLTIPYTLNNNEDESIQVTLDAVSLNGFMNISELKILANETVDLDTRDLLLGESIVITTHESLAKPSLDGDLYGIESLLRVENSVSSFIISESGAASWKDYTEVSKVLPLVADILEAQSTELQKLNDSEMETYGRSLLKLAFGVTEKYTITSAPNLAAELGPINKDDMFTLTGLELNEDDIDEALDAVGSYFENGGSLDYAISHFTALSAPGSINYLESSEEELQAQLNARLKDQSLGRDDLEEVKVLNSNLKLQKILNGKSASLSSEDLENLQLQKPSENELEKFNESLLKGVSQGEITSANIIEMLNTLIVTKGEKESALQRLLSESREIRKTTALLLQEEIEKVEQNIRNVTNGEPELADELIRSIWTDSETDFVASISDEDFEFDFIEFKDSSGDPIAITGDIYIKPLNLFIYGEPQVLQEVTGFPGRYEIPQNAKTGTSISVFAEGKEIQASDALDYNLIKFDGSLRLAELNHVADKDYDQTDLSLLKGYAEFQLEKDNSLDFESLISGYDGIKDTVRMDTISSLIGTDILIGQEGDFEYLSLIDETSDYSGDYSTNPVISEAHDFMASKYYEHAMFNGHQEHTDRTYAEVNEDDQLIPTLPLFDETEPEKVTFEEYFG